MELGDNLMARASGLALAAVVFVAGCGDLMMPGQSRQDTGRDAPKAGPFDGVYVLDHDAVPPVPDDEAAELVSLTETLFSPLAVRGDTIRYGSLIVGEFALLDPVVTGDVLESAALWHHDIHDPGDMTEVRVTLRRDGERLHLTIVDAEDDLPVTMVYRRKRS
jgi:hypothetical protein